MSISRSDKQRIAVAPLPNHVWRSQKIHLLHTIESEMVEASLSETIVDSLEAIEDLDRRQGIQVTPSMRAAYCDVATELTVKFLASSEGKPSSKYKEVVDRIWKGRVRELESEGSELISAELKDRMDEMEAAVSDSVVSDKLSRLNTRYDAVRSVKAYVKEAHLAMRDPEDEFVVMGIDEAEPEVVPVGNGHNRRRVKNWSVQEEDMLRAGVKKFGRGNWKIILDESRDVFGERTSVDLKNKWSCMTK